MNFSLYIKNTLVDFEDNVDIPFEFRDAVDDFEKYGSVRFSELSSFSREVTLPATKNNLSIIDSTELMSCYAVSDGQQVFSGFARLTSRTIVRNTVVAIQLEVFGGNAEIMKELENVSLRALDLGTVDWSDAEIQSSWTGSYSTDAGIFAPVLYGQLQSGTNDWSEEDFRYHVYFDTIMNGIADYLGVTLDSTFFTTDLWRKCVNIYGAGNQVRRVNIQSGTASLTASPSPTLTYTTSTEGGYFIITINIPSTGSASLYEIKLTAGSYTSPAYVYTTGSPLIVVSEKIYVDATTNITVTGYEAGGTVTTDLPIGSQMTITMQNEATVDSEVYVSSYLHDRPVKEWLRGIFEMFNLVSAYNPFTKVWTIEPRFDYTIGSTTYQGFYKNSNDAVIKTLDAEDEYVEDFKLLYGTIELAYKEDEILNTAIESQNEQNNQKANTTKTVINDIDNHSLIVNSFYSDAHLVSSTRPISTQGFLCCLPSSYDYLQDEEIPVPDFECEPKCALVLNKTQGILYNSSSEIVPLIMQSNIYDTTNLYSLSYNDSEFTFLTTSYTAKGLTSIFYERHFAILRNYKVLNIRAKIDTILKIDNFRNLYQFKDSLYLLIEINNFNVIRQDLSDCMLVAYRQQQSTDAANTTHNQVTTLLSV